MKGNKTKIRLDPNKRRNRLSLLITIILIFLILSRKPIKPENKPYIAVDDKTLLNETLEEDQFISYNIMKEYIDPYLFYDDKNKILILTTEDLVKKYDFNKNTITENRRLVEDDNTVILDGGNLKFKLDYLFQNYDYDCNYNQKRKQLIINTKKDNIGIIKKKGKNIYSSSKKFSKKYNKKLKTGDKVFIYDEINKYYKVRTEDGVLGYIAKNKVDYNKKDKEEDKFNKKIHLTWDFIHKKTNNTILSNIRPLEGVTHISPTWFELNQDGSLVSKANDLYVRKYNDLDIDVWPTITNTFDPNLTEEVLLDSFKREKLIYEIIENYKKYNVQGINIDFENIHLTTKDYLVQFVRELYPLFKEENMKVSMDITTISTSTNWSRSYDRKKLGESVDYLVLMAYDQYWASSPTAGSVAEYPWVSKGIEELLNYVPREKIILGLPLYSRLWIGEEGDLKSKSLTMPLAKEFILNNNIEINWKQDIKQYYGEKEIDGKLNRIWLEEEESLVEKIGLIHDYKIKGVASWRKGYEEEGLFKIMGNEIFK